MEGGWVYILTNKPHGVLYVGVTADLARRVAQHRLGQGGAFTRRYNCSRLVHAEAHGSIEDAIAREKAIKAWPRLWKLRLIQEHNPRWDDLFESLNG
ncbi:MAG TPA: GIY-YIG nuclease family protein [Allosphingosinicella sp.]|nr:GIY-YIG nuclease family protein [Allosphingosinicella sp.]